MELLRSVGLLDTKGEQLAVDWWPEAIEQVLGARVLHNLADSIAARGSSPEEAARLATALRSLGLLTPTEPYDRTAPTRLDALCVLLHRRLQYAPGERDLCIMVHRVVAKRPDGTRELHSSTLLLHGDSCYSAMARTVGLPVAVSARLLLEGRLAKVGLLVPTDREIYEPVLEECAREGIQFRETRSTL